LLLEQSKEETQKKIAQKLSAIIDDSVSKVVDNLIALYPESHCNFLCLFFHYLPLSLKIVVCLYVIQSFFSLSLQPMLLCTAPSLEPTNLNCAEDVRLDFSSVLAEFQNYVYSFQLPLWSKASLLNPAKEYYVPALMPPLQVVQKTEATAIADPIAHTVSSFSKEMCKVTVVTLSRHADIP
jgi:hypothetical protein